MNQVGSWIDIDCSKSVAIFLLFWYNPYSIAYVISITLTFFRKKKAYVCSHKRVWSNCQQADIEKQQCGYDGITESVCRSRVQTQPVTNFSSNAVTCLDVAIIRNQWFNAFCLTDHQRKITKVPQQVAEWPLLALFSSHYFSSVFHLLGFLFMWGDTALGQAWIVSRIQMPNG